MFNAGGVQLNGVIQSLAAQYGATYVDTATPFLGNEARYTFQALQPAGSSVGGQFGGVLPIGNVHPNALGYDVIAAQVAAAASGATAGGAMAVPEPSALALLGTGVAFALGFTRRRTLAV